ncbi:MAG: zinc transporter ZntB, partial [Candidatus Schmidhempelia sp.]|nr:zinc transporter ZntB [Candidatus Schmidhempelia sp.]
MVERNTISLTGKQFLEAKPIYCYQLNGKGGANLITLEAVTSKLNPFWLHLDDKNQDTIQWLSNTDLIPDIAKTDMLNHDELPREVRFDITGGILVVLKGVNTTSNGLPAPPVATLRFYITDTYIISIQHQKIKAVDQLHEQLNKNIGPVDVADWLVQIFENLTDYANSAVEKIHNQVIKLEDKVLSDKRIIPHKEMSHIRQQLILLRRILTPQRDIFTKISTERLSWIDDNDRQHMHDVSGRLNIYVSEIDSCLTRLASIIDQINSMLTESMNKRIYVMSLVSTIFLPLTFLTSLFGVNLSGIPFNEFRWAFGGF